MLKETFQRYPEVPVKNTVIWINPNINLPFNLKVGEKTSLGVFVVDPSVLSSSFSLGINHFHGRSALLGRVHIADSQGNIYNDVDLKGVGHIKNRGHLEEKPSIIPIEIRHKTVTSGTWRRERAEREVSITEDLIAKGVRTYRIGALIALDEIALPDGSKLSIEEAKSIQIMHDTEQPVVGLRLYRFRERFQHAWEDKEYLLNEAKKIVGNEIKRELSWQDFLTYFSETLGSNLGAIHAAGYWHGSLDEHNVSLAAEIIDFGLDFGGKSFSKKIEDLETSERGWIIRQDYRNAYDRVGQLCGMVQWDLKKHEELIPETHFGKIFHRGYISRSKNGKAPFAEPQVRRELQERFEPGGIRQKLFSFLK